MKKTILLLATGGTIATTYRDDLGGYAAGLNGEELVRSVAGNVRLKVEDFARINSTYIKPEDMLRLGNRITELTEQGDVDGVVITHGTSTMEETAFFLDVVLKGDVPVVITGAQRAAIEPWPDGPANLNDAVRVAADEQSRGQGVTIVFAGEIHAAREARKDHTTGLKAFSSGQFGPIGYVDSESVCYYRRVVPGEKVPVKSIETRVDLIKFAAGMDAKFIKTSIESGTKGLVIEGVGLGNVNEEFYWGIKEARKYGLTVVMVSRSGNGRVIPKYGYLGGGASLVKEGVIFGGSLTGPKARLLLMICLGAGMNESQIREVFASF